MKFPPRLTENKRCIFFFIISFAKLVYGPIKAPLISLKKFILLLLFGIFILGPSFNSCLFYSFTCWKIYAQRKYSKNILFTWIIDNTYIYARIHTIMQEYINLLKLNLINISWSVNIYHQASLCEHVSSSKSDFGSSKFSFGFSIFYRSQIYNQTFSILGWTNIE